MGVFGTGEDTHFHLSKRRGLRKMDVRGNYVEEKQLHVYK